MDLQRKIQQLRNDGDDEFADAIEDMIPRATVAAALRELRAKLDSMMFNERHKTSFDAIQKAQVELNATIAALGLESDAFDALIASRPDALEELAGEALGGKSKTNACFDCGSGDVADTCPECQKAFCENCVEKDEGCCEKEETK